MPWAVILQSRADPVDCPDSFRPADWLQPTTSLPSNPVVAFVASPNRDENFDSTLDYFGNVQHQHASGLLKNNYSQYDNAKSLNLTPTAVFHNDTDKAGGILSPPSVTHSTQFAHYLMNLKDKHSLLITNYLVVERWYPLPPIQP